MWNLDTQFVTHVEDETFSPADHHEVYSNKDATLRGACVEISEFVNVEKLKG